MSHSTWFSVGWVFLGIVLAGLATVMPELLWLFLALALGCWAIGVFVWFRQRHHQAAKRPVAIPAVDVATGLLEFRDRIAEGNAMIQTLRRLRRPIPAAQRDELVRQVAEWNTRCVETVTTYLPYREPEMGKPRKRSAWSTVRRPRWLGLLQQEVEQKIDRLFRLQAELAQSSSAAISSQVQT